jgi:hypothetical protein
VNVNPNESSFDRANSGNYLQGNQGSTRNDASTMTSQQPQPHPTSVPSTANTATKVVIRRASNQPAVNANSAAGGGGGGGGVGQLQGVTKIQGKPTAIHIRKSSHQLTAQPLTPQPQPLAITNLHSRGMNIYNLFV